MSGERLVVSIQLLRTLLFYLDMFADNDYTF